MGLLTFLDPPRPDTKDTIEKALEFGVDVKMITGWKGRSVMGNVLFEDCEGGLTNKNIVRYFPGVCRQVALWPLAGAA